MEAIVKLTTNVQENIDEFTTSYKQPFESSNFLSTDEVGFVPLFVLQAQLVVGIAFFFRKEAFQAVQILFKLSYSSLMVAVLSATLTCIIYFFIARSYSHQFPRVAFFVPWALPIVAALVSFQQWQNTVSIEFQSQSFSLAAISYLSMAIAFCCGGSHLSFALVMAKAASTSLTVHPQLIREMLFISTLYTVWTICWALAVLGVYHWNSQARQPVPCLVDFQEWSASSVFTFLNIYQATGKQETLCEEGDYLQPVTMTLLGLSLFWTHRTCKAVVKSSIESTLISWWERETTTPGDRLERNLLGQFAYHCTECLMKIFVSPGIWKPYHSSSKVSLPSKEDQSCDETPSSKSSIPIVRGEAIAASLEGTMVTVWETVEKPSQNMAQSVDSFFLLFRFAVSMTTGNLTWLAESSHSSGAFLLGFAFGWVISGTFVGILQAASKALSIGVAGFVPDGHLLKTRLYFEVSNAWELSNETTMREVTRRRKH